jgi:superoxide dismutase, Fe-Mn family
MLVDRRYFLILIGATTGAAALSNWSTARADNAQLPKPNNTTFKLPPLPYAYDALEPYIDKRTMEFHHDKHHATYVKNLNEAISKYPNLKGKSVEELLQSLNSIPDDIRKTVRNNGGGHLNHTMFWEIMSANPSNKPRKPQGELAKAINQTFGSFEKFQQQFNEAGTKQFGSGWAWLVKDKDGALKVASTANQDSPILEGMSPIMGNDVWEHAYYLKYQNRRADYLKSWWNVVNWEEVNRRYQRSLK